MTDSRRAEETTVIKSKRTMVMTVGMVTKVTVWIKSKRTMVMTVGIVTKVTVVGRKGRNRRNAFAHDS